ncbi:trimeric intracellular cation channel family protein [Nocardia stercoris]|uniref:Trimeric intracellular cation channel family protein n=1 Tax=Nocardia stercoris TaxID=2483361 RepID=A0A3M2L3A7_9NOCA|nr:trimeric intracellular cation channel family protein [Nocardia stercoris]RMI32127.1 trimeric intracellular cation channel family protein [Nocardia stercoris]
MLSAVLAQPEKFHTAVSVGQQVGEHVGIFAFAVSGALLAVQKKFDIIGIAVLATVTAVGGGIIRDLVIGRTPPIAFTRLSYAVVALAGALLIFCWHPPLRLTRWPLYTTDAFGLGIFCVTGTETAHRSGLGGPSAAIVGVVAAVGGGVLRDLLAGEIPLLLRRDSELYAIPALVGCTATALLIHYGHLDDFTGAIAALAVFALRVLALRYHWHAPQARPHRRR